MTKFVYCVFQEAMRNDIPADAPERAHVWPVLSDSVNTLGGGLKGKKGPSNEWCCIAFCLFVLVPLTMSINSLMRHCNIFTVNCSVT